MNNEQSNQNNALETTKRFRDFMAMKGFATLVVSDYASNYSSDVTWLPDGTLCWERVARAAAWFNVDIIIVCTETVETSLKKGGRAYLC